MRECVAHELGAARQPQLLHDVRPVRLGGAHGDEELLGDLLVRVPEREQAQHFALAVRKRILLGLPSCVGVRGDQPRAELGVDVATATGNFANSRDDFDVGGLLEHVAARAGRECRTDVAWVVLHREDEDLRLRPLSQERRDHLEAVAVRHHDVNEDHVGFQAPGFEDRLTPGSGLADRLDVVLTAEQKRDPRADNGVVVDDQDLDRLCHASLTLITAGGGVRRNPQSTRGLSRMAGADLRA